MLFHLGNARNRLGWCKSLRMVKGSWFIIGIPRFIALLRYCIFYKLKVCGNPASSKSLLFFQQHLLTSCLCVNICSLYVSITILAILQPFSLFFIINKLIPVCCDLWSVIFGVTVVIVLVHHKQCSCKMAGLINVYILTAPLIGHSPIYLSIYLIYLSTYLPTYLSFSPPPLSVSVSPGLPIPCDTTILKLGQLITQQWPLGVQVKGRVTRLNLNARNG